MTRQSAWLACLCVAALGACKGEPPAPTAQNAPSASASAALPLDRLLPGELAEGKDRALGMLLPREMRVVRSFRDSAVARGRVTPEALTDYVRKRVSATAVQTSVERTTFLRVHINGQAPDRQVKVDIVRDGEATMLLIDDITPPEPVPGLSDDERWRRAGVNPNNPLDPSKL